MPYVANSRLILPCLCPQRVSRREILRKKAGLGGTLVKEWKNYYGGGYTTEKVMVYGNESKLIYLLNWKQGILKKCSNIHRKKMFR